MELVDGWWTDAAWPLLAAAARGIPAVVLVLTLGARLVPWSVSVALGLVPVVLSAPDLAWPEAVNGALALGIVAKEALLGLSFGLVGATLFWGISAAAGLWDQAARPEAPPPEETATGPLGGMFAQLAVVIFFLVNGHRWLLLALERSYQLIPLTHLPDTDAAAAQVAQLLTITGHVLLVALALAAPALLAALLTRLVLALAGRLGAHALVGPWSGLATTLVLVLLLAGSAAAIVGVVPALMDGTYAELDRAMRGLAP